MEKEKPLIVFDQPIWDQEVIKHLTFDYSEILLNDYDKKVYSQHGQDGQIEKLFDIIGSTNKYFVEFGSNGTRDGGGNTAYLRNFGFDGLLIDGYEDPYGEPVKRDYPVKIHMMSYNNVNEVFEQHNVPKDFDFLSIDIDGQDFHVWKALDDIKFKPRVVLIESNYHFHPDEDLVMQKDESFKWDGTECTGSSSTALCKLGKAKGYRLVSICGPDLLFVLESVCQEKNIHFAYENDPKMLYIMNQVKTGRCDALTPNNGWLMSTSFITKHEKVYFQSSDVFLNE